MIYDISVIIPVYNRFDQLKQVVESILAQTCPVSEIILVDDGSIDGTSETLPRHVETTPAWRKRVRYLYQQNQGQSAALNKGIAAAKGEWLAFNANDDLWLPQKLEWQFRALEQFKDQCGVCFTDAWFMNNPLMKMTLFQLGGREHKECIGKIPDSIQYVLEAAPPHGIHPVWVQTMVVRTDLVRRIEGFDARLRYGEDDDFVFRLACKTNFCFVGMPMVLIDRTRSPQRHIGAAANWHKADYLLAMNQHRFEKRLSISQGLSPEVQKTVRRSLSAVHSGWANWYLYNSEYAKACAAASQAVKYHCAANLAVKWALTRIAPRVARKLMLIRNQRSLRRTQGTG